MTEGNKLSELTALGTMQQTDRLYAVRGSESYSALVSDLRILAAQVSDASEAGRSVLTAANVAAIRTVLELASMALQAASAVAITGGTAKFTGDALAAAADGEVAVSAGVVDTGNGLRYRGDQVVGPRGAAIADADEAEDDESAAFTGIDNAQVGEVYAQLADLNALRAAYEDLRAGHNALVTLVNTLLARLRATGGHGLIEDT